MGEPWNKPRRPNNIQFERFIMEIHFSEDFQRTDRVSR